MTYEFLSRTYIDTGALQDEDEFLWRQKTGPLMSASRKLPSFKREVQYIYIYSMSVELKHQRVL